jgi:hypothetical protein
MWRRTAAAAAAGTPGLQLVVSAAATAGQVLLKEQPSSGSAMGFHAAAYAACSMSNAHAAVQVLLLAPQCCCS